MISEALTRPLGPLAAWQWALVAAGGYVGYRFLTGRGISSGGGGAATTTGSTGSNIIQGPQGETGATGPSGSTFGITAQDITDWLNAGASADDIKKIIDDLKPPVPTPKPVPSPNPGRIGPPSHVPPPITYGKIWGSDVPAAIKNVDPSGTGIAALFKKLHLGYGTVVNMGDLKAAFNKVKLSYGSVIEAKDLQNLLKKEGITPHPAVVQTTTTAPKVATAIPETQALVAPATNAPMPTASIAALGIPNTGGISAPNTTIGNQTPGQSTTSPTRLVL